MLRRLKKKLFNKFTSTRAKIKLAREESKRQVDAKVRELKALQARRAEAENALATMLYIKNEAEVVDAESLNKNYEVLKRHVLEFKETDQVLAIAKAEWCMSLVSKELKLVEMGYTRAVKLAGLFDFVENHRSETIYLEPFETYTNPVPKEVRKKYAKVKDIFDEIIIVYTNTSQLKKRKIKKEKDPILIGLFTENITAGNTVINVASDLGYIIADWQDEFCDMDLAEATRKAAKMGVDLNLVAMADPASLDSRLVQLDNARSYAKSTSSKL